MMVSPLQPPHLLREESRPTPLSAVDIEHEDFEWLRAYLQRETNPLSDSDCSRDASIVGRKHKSHHSSSHSSTSCDSPTEDQRIGTDSWDGEGDHIPGKRRKVGWTSTEDLVILTSVRKLGTQWPRIATQLPGRTADAVRNRWHRLQKTHALGNGEEGSAALDALLLASGMPVHLTEHSTSGSDVQMEEGEERKTGSAHGRSMWTAEEDRLIEEGVRRFGCKWRQIATALPGRSDSSIRNRWMRLQREKAESRRAGASGAGEPGAPAAGLLASPSAPPTSLSTGLTQGFTLDQVEEEGEALPWYQPRRSLSSGVAAPAPAACAGSPRDRPPPASKVFGQEATPVPQPAAASVAPLPPSVALPWASSPSTAPAVATSVHIAQRLSDSGPPSDETGVSASTGHCPPPASNPVSNGPWVPAVGPLTAVSSGKSLPGGEANAPVPASPLGGPTQPGQAGLATSGGAVPPAATSATATTSGGTALEARQPPLWPPSQSLSQPLEPLGYGAPLRGFDLGSFMHAVTCAVEPISEPSASSTALCEADRVADDDLHDLFEVCELGSAQLNSRPTTMVHTQSSSPCDAPKREQPEDCVAPPRCLRLASSLFVAMSALAVGATLLPAARG